MHYEELEDAFKRQKKESMQVKREQWKNLQEQAPDTAKFIIEMAKVFGDDVGEVKKLKAVSVEVDGKLIVDWR
ncbi:MAG: hypothetical protein WC901_00905 [Candidatus Margulisiibacteriota bacterium]